MISRDVYMSLMHEYCRVHALHGVRKLTAYDFLSCPQLGTIFCVALQVCIQALLAIRESFHTPTTDLWHLPQRNALTEQIPLFRFGHAGATTAGVEN